MPNPDSMPAVSIDTDLGAMGVRDCGKRKLLAAQEVVGGTLFISVEIAVTTWMTANGFWTIML